MLNFVVNSFIIVTFIVALLLFLRLYLLARSIKSFNTFLEKEFIGFQGRANFPVWLKTVNSYFKDKLGHKLQSPWKHFVQRSQQAAEPPDVFDYINRDMIIHHIGQRKMIDSIPGFLISFGILGTFIGLYLGLSGLDNLEDSLQSGITTLIGGVNIAFLSSLIGIFLSILWMFFDKFIFGPYLEKRIEVLMNLLSTIFPQEGSDSYLKQMLGLQKEQLDSFRTLVTDTLIPDLVQGFKDVMQQSVVPHLEKNVEAIELMVEKSSQQQSDSLSAMSEHFLQSLNQSTGEYFEKLREALVQTIDWSQNVHEKAAVLIDQVVLNAESQFELSGQLKTLTDRFSDYTENITRFQFEMNTTIEELQDLGINLSTLQAAASSSMETTMTRQGEMDIIQEQIRSSMKEQLEAMESRMEGLKGHWSSTDQRFAQLNQNLSESMEQFAQHMYQGLDRTFDQFDKNLEQALKYLQSSVVGIDDAVSEMPKLMEDFQLNLKQLNEYLKETSVKASVSTNA